MVNYEPIKRLVKLKYFSCLPEYLCIQKVQNVGWNTCSLFSLGKSGSVQSKALSSFIRKLSSLLRNFGFGGPLSFCPLKSRGSAGFVAWAGQVSIAPVSESTKG